MQRRAVAVALAVGGFCLGLPAASVLAFPTSMLPGVANGQTWVVCQGYNNTSISHNGGLQYSLDLTADLGGVGSSGCTGSATTTANRQIVAPGSGTIAWNDGSGFCLNLDAGDSIKLYHVTGPGTGAHVTAGQAVGTVYPAGQAQNAGYAHLHLAAYQGAGCATGNRTTFSGVARLGCGAPNMSSSGAFNQWSGTQLTSTCAPSPPADSDGDGVPDSTDDCPTVDGPGSNRGCPLSALEAAPELTLGARSTTTDDFNGDGYEDLVVGSPGEDIGPVSDAGAVFVNYGGPGGLSSAGRIELYSGPGGLANSPEGGDLTGAALTSGDYNGDGLDDLVIGSPGENSSVADGGAVLTIMGSRNGLDTATSSGGRQGTLFSGADEATDYLGAALTTGDFNGDGYDDLAAGAPGESSDVPDGGIVLMVNGSSSGLDASTASAGRQGALFGNTDEATDYFGAALAAADFDGDGNDDLAAGAPGESSSIADGGVVLTVNGSAAGLDGSTASGGRQGGFLSNTDEANDYSGAALAAGDFNGDDYDDLAVGAPGENSSVPDGGIVLLVDGSAGGLDASTASGGRQGGLFAGADEATDYLGAALTTGDFNRDGFDDLAAGAPSESSSVADGGIVLTVNGSAAGLNASTAGGGRQGGLFANTDEANDHLGASLASADFNGDCYADLAAGVPGENSGVPDGGTVLTLNGFAGGLDAATAGGGRQGGFFAGVDEAGDFLSGGSNGPNLPPSNVVSTGAEAPSGNQPPPAGGSVPRPACKEPPPISGGPNDDGTASPNDDGTASPNDDGAASGSCDEFAVASRRATRKATRARVALRRAQANGKGVRPAVKRLKKAKKRLRMARGREARCSSS